MKLKNILIVVSDMDRAVRFYRELLGLQVVLDRGENVVLTEGLVLQDSESWAACLGRDLIPCNHMAQLYFEEKNIEDFVRRLEASDFQIEFVERLITLSWGQKLVRFYDPDGNLIEVRTPA